MLSQESILKAQIKRELANFYGAIDSRTMYEKLDLWFTRVDHIQNYNEAKLSYLRFRDEGLVQFPIKKWHNVMKSIMKLMKYYEKSE